jgi:hypothetical protein
MNKHPANNGKVMLSLWIDAPLRDYVRTRAREAGKPVSQWAGEVLMRAVQATSLGAFCFPPVDAAEDRDRRRKLADDNGSHVAASEGEPQCGASRLYRHLEDVIIPTLDEVTLMRATALRDGAVPSPGVVASVCRLAITAVARAEKAELERDGWKARALALPGRGEP